MPLTNHVAKKLGELLAFAQISQEIAEKTAQYGDGVFPMQKMKDTHAAYEKRLVATAQLSEITTQVQEQGAKSKEKIAAMQNTYLQEKWEDKEEVFEWLGFFIGAHLIHWSLVQDLAKEAGMAELEEFSRQAESFEKELLEQLAGAIKELN
jgi:hypothetical protein